jgi:CRP/FNR family transcriptional regulator, cyclic AMP receptor protein
MSMTDLDTAIAGFRADSSASGDQLSPRNWNEEDWRELFRFTSVRRIKAGELLIQRGDSDRTLYFVVAGKLEVVVRSGDGMSMGPLTRIGAGSVLGEQSFFDGHPRSASVWATDQCEVAAMSPEQYAAFEAANPARAHELIFALARVLAFRLRRTTARVLS